MMERRTKKQLVQSAFDLVRITYQKHPFLREERDDLVIVYSSLGNYGHDQQCSSRILGAEYFFQAQWFKAFEDLQAQRDFTFIAAKEMDYREKLDGKVSREKCDILILDTIAALKMSDRNHTTVDGQYNRKRYEKVRKGFGSDELAMIKLELKQTGANLHTANSYDHFFAEMVKYLADPCINNGECLYVFSCYYEDDPSKLKQILNEHGSLLNWVLHERGTDIAKLGVKVTESFRRNCIETYAFRGVETPWIFIDNAEFL